MKSSNRLLVLLLGMAMSTALPISANTPQDDEEKVYTVVEQEPAYPGGNDALLGYISRNVRYPSFAQKYDAQGKVIVRFVVNKTGRVEGAKVIGNTVTVDGLPSEKAFKKTADAKNMTYEQYSQAIKAECINVLSEEANRVIMSLPRFAPGKLDGKPVATYITIPIRFSLK